MVPLHVLWVQRLRCYAPILAAAQRNICWGRGNWFHPQAAGQWNTGVSFNKFAQEKNNV